MLTTLTRADVFEQYGDKHRIKWDLVDPILERMKEPRVTELATLLGIPVQTLRARRKELGLPPLPCGRPNEIKLTTYQRQVKRRLENGETMTDLAKERGVTVQAIMNTVRTIGYKVAAKKERCGVCDGYGVIECGQENDTYARRVTAEGSGRSCSSVGPHQHVCEQCGGEGKIPQYERNTEEE